MRSYGFLIAIGLALAALSLGGRDLDPVQRAARAGRDTTAHSRVVLSQALPRLDGAHLAVTVVEVSYGPGGASTPHRHPCPVVGYIIEGAFRSRVEGGAESTYTAGQSFYEAPNAVHAVSANASGERPVRFLASFTCDHQTPLSTAVPEYRDSASRRP